MESLSHERAKSDHSGEEKKPRSARKANRKSLYDAPSSPLHKDSEDENQSLKRAKSKKDAKKDNSDDSKEEKEKRHHKKRKSSSAKLTNNINSPRSDKSSSSPRKIDSARPADSARSEVDSFAMEEPKPTVVNNTTRPHNNNDEIKREASSPSVKIDEKPVVMQAKSTSNTSESGPASVASEEQPKSLRDSAIERLRSPSKTDVKVSPAFKRLEASLATDEKKDAKLTSTNSVTKLTASTDSKGAASSTEEKPAVTVETKVETGTGPQQPQQAQKQPPQAQPKRPGQSPANSRNNSTSNMLPKSNSSASINGNIVAPKQDDGVIRAVSHVRKISTNSNGSAANGTGIQREDSVNITDMEGKAANVSVQIKQLEDDIKVRDMREGNFEGKCYRWHFFL